MKNNIFKFITHQKQVTRQKLLVEKLLTLNLKKEANADVSSSFKRQVNLIQISFHLLTHLLQLTPPPPLLTQKR